MILCLVTDRRRLGTSLGVAPGDWLDALRAQVSAAAAAGVDLVQVREPDLEAAALARLVTAIVADTRETNVQVLVNDRLDVALAAGAAGVHLRERSFTVADARRLAPPGFVIGRSIHGALHQISEGIADYLIAGTVLATPSKPAATCLGWPGLAAVVKSAGDRPVLAIGGVDVSSIPFVASTGAAGAAAIGAFIPGNRQSLAEFVQKRVIDLRLGFDSAHPVS
ncbi:MAG: thiamine phosphate synthase [Vicinamibacterales bacterium]